MAQVVTFLLAFWRSPIGLNTGSSWIFSVPPGEYQDSALRQAITTSLKLFQIHKTRSYNKIRAETTAGLITAT